MVSDAIDIALVLILVLMEYGLWQIHDNYHNRAGQVLILVLMEYGLWPALWGSQTLHAAAS